MDRPKRRPLGERNRNTFGKQVAQVKSHVPDHEDKENLESSPLTCPNKSDAVEEKDLKDESFTKPKPVVDLCVIGGQMNGKTRRSYALTDFDLCEMIGSGKYGKVYRARDRVENRTVALKLIEIESIHGADFLKQTRREIEIQGNIEHPNIIKLLGVFVNKNTLYLILEFAQQGSLYDLLQSTGVMKEQDVVRILKLLIGAVQHLHSHCVIHRDIKPENVLICDDDLPKLADFGWSVLSMHGRQKTLCGTVDYLAPETVKGNGYDHRVDIWSIGVLCYELLFGNPPFVSDTFLHTSQKIKTADFTFPDSPIVSQRAKNFINSILVSDPESRLRLEEILNHEFING